MFGALARLFKVGTTRPTDTGAAITTGMPVETLTERSAYYQGREAATMDIPRWRHALENITDAEKARDGVTIPAHEPFQGTRRDFLRHGGPGLHGYFDQLREEFGDSYWIQAWWDTQRGSIGDAIQASKKGSVYRPYIRPFLPLAEAEKRLADLKRETDWSNEDTIVIGRLEDEIREIKRITTLGKPLPN